MNPLTKMEVLSILMSYQKFLKSYKTELKITKANFNQIKYIADKISDKKSIKEYWGDTFDKIYLFLERTEIKVKLEPKKTLNLEIKSKEIIRPLNENAIKNILSTYRKFLNSYNEDLEITNDNFKRLKHISDIIIPRKSIIKEQYGNIFDEVYLFLEKLKLQSEIRFKSIDKIQSTKGKSEKLRVNKTDKLKAKSKQKTKNKSKKSKKPDKSLLKSKNKPKTERELICESIKEQAIRIREQRDFHVFNPEAKTPAMPPYNFESPKKTYDQDILDEKRAEGKGYSGSK